MSMGMAVAAVGVRVVVCFARTVVVVVSVLAEPREQRIDPVQIDGAQHP
jgi:hypothetical protein